MGARTGVRRISENAATVIAAVINACRGEAAAECVWAGPGLFQSSSRTGDDRSETGVTKNRAVKRRKYPLLFLRSPIDPADLRAYLVHLYRAEAILWLVWSILAWTTHLFELIRLFGPAFLLFSILAYLGAHRADKLRLAVLIFPISILGTAIFYLSLAYAFHTLWMDRGDANAAKVTAGAFVAALIVHLVACVAFFVRCRRVLGEMRDERSAGQ